MNEWARGKEELWLKEVEGMTRIVAGEVRASVVKGIVCLAMELSLYPE